MSHTLFKLNYGYYLCLSFKDECDACFKFFSTNRLAVKLKKLMNIYYQNFLYVQDFQKQAHDNGMKPYSYAPSEKFCLNSKYIRTKQNQKLKVKFFGPF